MADAPSDFQEGLRKALEKLIEQQEKDSGIVRVPAPRDYVPCSWCGSRGCAACFAKREQRRKDLDEEYKRQFPDGPKPIFTTRLDNPEDIARARRVIGREAIEKAFGPDGGGVEEIVENARRESVNQPPIGKENV